MGITTRHDIHDNIEVLFDQTKKKVLIDEICGNFIYKFLEIAILLSSRPLWFDEFNIQFVRK